MKGTDMTPYIPANVSTWLVNWKLVSNSPPRDPNDDDEEEKEEEDEDKEEEEDENEEEDEDEDD